MTVLNPLRRFRLRMQVRYHGGSVLLGRGVCLDHPVRFQGMGTLTVEDNVIFGFRMGGSGNNPILMQPRDEGARISIGSGSAIMNGCEFISRTGIMVGRSCRIGANVKIMDADFHGVEPERRHEQGQTSPVEIADNVWVGSDVLILKGVSIGRDSIIGAGSVVTRDIPAGSVAAGNPARIIRSLYAESP